MRRSPLFVFALAVVLFPPGVQAGTEEQPELEDAAGDQEPAVPPLAAAATAHADVRSAWYHDEAPEAFQVTLKVTKLDLVSVAVYDVFWIALRNGTEALGLYGVRARINQTDSTWYTIQAPLKSEVSPSDFTQTASIAGEAQRAEPGRLTWTVPRTALPARDGDAMIGLYAVSFVDAPTGNQLPPYDQGQNQTAEYHLGAVTRILLDQFIPPSRIPDLGDVDGDILPPSVDLTALWVDFTTDQVQATLEVSQLERAGLEECQWIGLLRLDDPASEPRARLEFGARVKLEPGRITPVEFQADANFERVDGRLLVREGTPGYFRFEAGRSAWTGGVALADLHVRAATACARENGDVLEYYPSSDIGALGPVAAAASALAAAVWARRRKF